MSLKSEKCTFTALKGILAKGFQGSHEIHPNVVIGKTRHFPHYAHPSSKTQTAGDRYKLEFESPYAHGALETALKNHPPPQYEHLVVHPTVMHATPEQIKHVHIHLGETPSDEQVRERIGFYSKQIGSHGIPITLWKGSTSKPEKIIMIQKIKSKK